MAERPTERPAEQGAERPTEQAEVPALVERCRQMDNRQLLGLYAEFLGHEEEIHLTSLPALALRERARAGEVEDELVPLLTICLVDAPNLSTFTHLVKALAAFGRKAEMAGPYVVDRLRSLHVTNERRLWVFDSALHALGYLGGEAARTFVAELEGESPSRVLASRSVYQGEPSDEERQRMFEATLTRVRTLLAEEDPGGWTNKRTERVKRVGKQKPSRMAPWMIR